MSLNSDSSLHDILTGIIRECIKEILDIPSADDVMTNSKVMGLLLEKAKAKNKNIRNLSIDTEQIEINQYYNKSLSNQTQTAA